MAGNLCALCDEGKELQVSHVIPKFVYRWHLNNSDGPLRFSMRPNQRVQDGYKEKLLCINCEQLLSGWEKKFSAEIFLPIKEQAVSSINYGEWFLKFATSIIWRAVKWLEINSSFEHLNNQKRNSLDTAMGIWKKYLRDEIDSPNEFLQQLLIMGPVNATSFQLPNNFNTYLLTTLDLDLFSSSSDLFVYVKIFELIFIAPISVKEPENWKFNSISSDGDVINFPYDIAIPAQIMDVFQQRCAHLNESFDQISQNQLNKILDYMNKNNEDYLNSTSSTAREQDKLMQMGKDEVQRCLNDTDYLIKKYFLGKKYCLGYNQADCDGQIIKSHILSAKFLRNISRDNHIYDIQYSHHHEQRYAELKIDGIKKPNILRATAFCAKHDKMLFRSFEDSEFIPTYKQIYDISFRTLAREYYQKKCLTSFFNQLKEHPLKELDKTGFTQSELYKTQLNHSIKENADHKFLYDQFKKFTNSGLKYIVVKTSKLPISAGGVLFPLWDINGNKIQKEKSKQLGFIYNIVSTDNQSFIIVSTVMNLHNNTHTIYLQSLRDTLKKNKSLFVNFMLNNAIWNNDILAFEPSWYDSLDQEFKDVILSLINHNVGNYSDTKIINTILKFSDIIEISDVSLLEAVF